MARRCFLPGEIIMHEDPVVVAADSSGEAQVRVRVCVYVCVYIYIYTYIYIYIYIHTYIHIRVMYALIFQYGVYYSIQDCVL